MGESFVVSDQTAKVSPLKFGGAIEVFEQMSTSVVLLDENGSLFVKIRGTCPSVYLRLSTLTAYKSYGLSTSLPHCSSSSITGSHIFMIATYTAIWNKMNSEPAAVVARMHTWHVIMQARTKIHKRLWNFSISGQRKFYCEYV